MVVRADKVPKLPTSVRLYSPGVTLAVTFMVAVDEELAGFGANVAVMPVGHPDGVNSTTELKPFSGVTATVEVPGDAAVAAAAVALKVKLGAAATVIGMVVAADRLPLVPPTGSEYDPGATVAATLMLTTEDVTVGFVPNVPLIPAGHPDAARVTAALKPLAGVTVTEEEKDAAEFRGNWLSDS